MKSKDSNSEKSVSYQKKDGLGHARPSFFWYDNNKDLQGLFSRDTPHKCSLMDHLVRKVDVKNTLSSETNLQGQ